MHTSLTGSKDEAGRRLRVVIVDDDRACAEGLTDAVEDFGAQAWTCLNGAEAIALIRQCRPDIVFLDLEMPGVSGLDVAGSMRMDQTLNAVKLVAVSGHNDREARDQTAKAGFDLHIAKPFKLASLEGMLDLVSATLLGGTSAKVVA